MNIITTPRTQQEFQQYFHFRWQILRAPWHQPQGSEQDDLEQQAFHRMIVDEQSNTILAVARLHMESQHVAQIRYMAVSPDAQGKGLGRLLLESLEELAINVGAKEILLNARENARPFYLASSYQQTAKTHLLFDEIQHYQMKKSLVSEHHHVDSKHKQLEQLWHQTIPMAKAMGLQANFYDGQTFIVSADTDFNKNLHNTMFAGSIYTLATLTGWGWMYLALKDNDLHGDIVLADANIRYLKPLAGAAYAQIDEKNVQGELSIMNQGRNGKLTIEVGLYCGDVLCAQFVGKYVAINARK